MPDVTPARLAELIRGRYTGPMPGLDADYHDTTAALRELESARTTLEGVRAGTHCIVPREPTREMMFAGWKFSQIPAEVYRAMLATEKEQENGKGINAFTPRPSLR